MVTLILFPFFCYTVLKVETTYRKEDVMPLLPHELQEEREVLLNELNDMDEFRRGSINTVFRRCGHAKCACANKDHPGHGPQMTLTYKDKSRTHTVTLRSSEAIALTHKQVKEHNHFKDWCRRWLELQEKLSRQRLEQVLAGEVVHHEKSAETLQKQSDSLKKNDEPHHGRSHKRDPDVD